MKYRNTGNGIICTFVKLSFLSMSVMYGSPEGPLTIFVFYCSFFLVFHFTNFGFCFLLFNFLVFHFINFGFCFLLFKFFSFSFYQFWFLFFTFQFFSFSFY